MLSFRSAVAEDAAVAAPLVYSSGPEQFDYVFSARDAGESQRFLKFAFATGEGRFAWRNHTVACIDDRVVGIGNSYGSEANLRFFFQDGWLILRFYGWRAFGVMLRGLRAERVIVPPKRGEWMIAHLGMDPGHRGQGIGARMVHHLIALGARAGKAIAVLDVSVENGRAESLYRRLGFELVIERGAALRSRFGRLMNHRRMALPIGRR